MCARIYTFLESRMRVHSTFFFDKTLQKWYNTYCWNNSFCIATLQWQIVDS